MVVQVAEQRVALAAVHPHDLVHEPARDPERAPTGDRVRAHERMLDRWELTGDAVGDLSAGGARHPFVEIVARVVADGELVAQTLHHR